MQGINQFSWVVAALDDGAVVERGAERNSLPVFKQPFGRAATDKVNRNSDRGLCRGVVDEATDTL